VVRLDLAKSSPDSLRLFCMSLLDRGVLVRVESTPCLHLKRIFVAPMLSAQP
jgi:hypothetical protein